LTVSTTRASSGLGDGIRRLPPLWGRVGTIAQKEGEELGQFQARLDVAADVDAAGGERLPRGQVAPPGSGGGGRVGGGEESGRGTPASSPPSHRHDHWPPPGPSMANAAVRSRPTAWASGERLACSGKNSSK